MIIKTTHTDNKAIDKVNSNRIGEPGNQFYFDGLKESHITDTIDSLNGLSNLKMNFQKHYKHNQIII